VGFIFYVFSEINFYLKVFIYNNYIKIDIDVVLIKNKIMTDFKNYDNVQSYNIDSVTLIDEVSADLIYIGVSINGSNITALNWRIKKIEKDGTVWSMMFPDGEQEFNKKGKRDK